MGKVAILVTKMATRARYAIASSLLRAAIHRHELLLRSTIPQCEYGHAFALAAPEVCMA